MDIVRENDWLMIQDNGAIRQVCEDVVGNPQFQSQLQEYAGGTNPRLFGFFVGQAMKASQGKGDPKLISKIMQELLPKPTGS